MDEIAIPPAQADAARLEWEVAAIEMARQQALRGECVTLEAIEAWVESIGTADELPPPTSAAALRP
jgi:predicted transcriptional regulator